MCGVLGFPRWLLSSSWIPLELMGQEAAFLPWHQLDSVIMGGERGAWGAGNRSIVVGMAARRRFRSGTEQHWLASCGLAMGVVVFLLVIVPTIVGSVLLTRSHDYGSACTHHTWPCPPPSRVPCGTPKRSDVGPPLSTNVVGAPQRVLRTRADPTTCQCSDTPATRPGLLDVVAAVRRFASGLHIATALTITLNRGAAPAPSRRS
jgi:hypothetical protein